MPTYIRVKDLANAATTPATDDFILLSGTANGARKISRADFLSAVAGFYTADPSTYKLATLDAGDKVLVSQLPSSAFSYQGTWAASTNTPTLANGTGTAGDTYYASDSGSVNFGAGSISFLAGDAVVYDGSVWQKVPDVVNLLDGKGTLDEAKTTLEIPDVGTGPQETPLNQYLGSLAYQSADSVAMANAEVETLEVTDKVTGPLTVSNTSAATSFILANSGGNTTLNFAVTENTGGIIDASEGASARNMLFKTGGTERVRIDSSGKVGIGLSSPGYPLQVEGAYFNANFPFNVAVQNNTTAYNVTDNGSGIVFGGRTAASGGLITALAGVAGCKANNTDGNHDGNLRVLVRENGASSMTESARFTKAGLVMGSGMAIDFGSGATLDDYEFGSHTTTVGVSGSGSVTLNTSQDRIGYTIIGDNVSITGKLIVASVSSPVGHLNITLPTVPANFTEEGAAGGGAVAYYDASANSWSSVPFSFEESSNSVAIRLDASTLAASDQIRLSFVYFQV